MLRTPLLPPSLVIPLGPPAILQCPFLPPSPAAPQPVTPEDLLLCHLDLAHRSGAVLEPQAAPGANSLPAADAPLPFPCAEGDGHSPLDVPCMLLHSLGKGGTFLLTFPLFHCPTGCLILLPMCSVTLFNPLPQRSHPWVQPRLNSLHQSFY